MKTRRICRAAATLVMVLAVFGLRAQTTRAADIKPIQITTVDCDSPDGKRIVSAGQDSVIRISRGNGQVYATFEPPKPAATTSAGSGQ